KVMLVSILVFGSILFIVSGKNFWESTFFQSEKSFGYFNQNKLSAALINAETEARENSSIDFMESKEASFINESNQKLEVDKMKHYINVNKQVAYKEVINNLANVEEPEIEIKDFLSELKTQEEYFDGMNNNCYTGKSNDFLAALYEKKNNEIQRSIEAEWQAENYLAVENEDALEVEVWMKNGGNVANNGNNNFDYLAEQLAKKNSEILKNIEIESYLKVEDEEPLALESWITGKGDVTEEKTMLEENHLLAANLAGKNAEVLKAIQFDCLVKGCLVLAVEEPLEVEDWMVDTKCWCPDKKQKKHTYTETFAYNK
ncbi:MAG: hypothetical protein ABFS16_02575, partial [Bacteroidota bacterium]